MMQVLMSACLWSGILSEPFHSLNVFRHRVPKRELDVKPLVAQAVVKQDAIRSIGKCCGIEFENRLRQNI
jgi:hypothetical protein